jgi:hypothetical protein
MLVMFWAEFYHSMWTLAKEGRCPRWLGYGVLHCLCTDCHWENKKELANLYVWSAGPDHCHWLAECLECRAWSLSLASRMSGESRAWSLSLATRMSWVQGLITVTGYQSAWSAGPYHCHWLPECLECRAWSLSLAGVTWRTIVCGPGHVLIGETYPGHWLVSQEVVMRCWLCLQWRPLSCLLIAVHDDLQAKRSCTVKKPCRNAPNSRIPMLTAGSSGSRNFPTPTSFGLRHRCPHRNFAKLFLQCCSKFAETYCPVPKFLF